MKDRNTVQLIGYVGIDPIIRKFPNGNTSAILRVATHTLVKTHDKTAKKQYNTVWHTVIAWAEAAAFAERNFLKGSHILVDGRVSYRTYENKQGQKKSVTEVVAQTLINLDR
jgi:single-strand DNA-binding protein